MKKFCMALCLLAVLMAGCTGRKAPAEVLVPVPTDSIDGTDEGLAEESDSQEQLIANEPLPLAADELFDDFFFNFASNRKLQLERIDFPLTVNSGHKQDSIRRGDWKMEHFFMRQDYYTLIFDSPEQQAQAQDTAVQNVTVEKIFLDDDFVRQYLFSRKSGRWMLYEVRNQTLPRNPNAAFLAFYRQFATDSVFQHESLAGQIEFVGPDPDDDFSVIEGMITPDFWDAFAPELPQKVLFNIVYGQQNPVSPTKILVLRGIANGLEVELTFRQERGRWKLTKLIT